MNDVVIVGGGLAGLAAAAWCGRAGLRVTVLERASRPGGRARTDREAGHAFNQGGHALYRGGAAARALADLGVPFAGGPPPLRGSLAISEGAVHRLPSGLVSILSTDLFGFGAKIEAARALTAIARENPGPPRDVTWRAWVDGFVKRPEVRHVLDAFARLSTYANAPGRASAGATIAQIRLSLEHGVLYLHGGWQTLVDGLERAARAAGAEVLTGRQVASVRRDGRSLVVSTEPGEPLRSRSVIVCAGPTTARTLLGVDSLGGTLALRAACLDVGLSELPRPDHLFALGIDRPTYFSVHSASARLADAGATLHVMKYLDPSEPHDAAADERELEEMLDRLQPGWRDRVTARRFLPGVVTTHALVEAAAHRPGVDSCSTEGVFVAGDWVGDEGMLADAALASARVASRMAIAHVAGVRERRMPREDTLVVA